MPSSPTVSAPHKHEICGAWTPLTFFLETAAVSDLTCLLQIADLLRAENLGTA
jgi:hypothetical protein